MGLAPGPHHRCQEKAEALVGALLGGCWAGTGAISAPRSPLSAPQWWSLCSLPVLAPSHSHTREVLWSHIQPLPPHSNKCRPPSNPGMFFLLLCVSPLKKNKTKKVQSTVAQVTLQRTNSGVVSSQAFSSAGHDKLLD